MSGTLKAHQAAQAAQAAQAVQAVHQAAHQAVHQVAHTAAEMIDEIILIRVRILIHHHFLKKYASSVIYINTEGAIFISFGIMESTNGFK